MIVRDIGRHHHDDPDPRSHRERQIFAQCHAAEYCTDGQKKNRQEALRSTHALYPRSVHEAPLNARAVFAACPYDMRAASDAMSESQFRDPAAALS